MTTEERIAMMDRAIERENQEERAKKEETEKKIVAYTQKVLAMSDRIKQLIELGESVRQRGKMPYIDSRDEKYNMDKVFVSNGISHRVGFMGHLRTPIRSIGFYAGGANGPWDFYANGNTVFVEHEDTKMLGVPSINDFKRFFEQFDSFEARFYAWFDKEFGEG